MAVKPDYAAWDIKAKTDLNLGDVVFIGRLTESEKDGFLIEKTKVHAIKMTGVLLNKVEVDTSAWGDVSSDHIFPTYEEAKKFVIQKCEKIIAGLKNKLVCEGCFAQRDKQGAQKAGWAVFDKGEICFCADYKEKE